MPFRHRVQKHGWLENGVFRVYVTELHVFDFCRNLLHIGMVGDLGIGHIHIGPPGIRDLLRPRFAVQIQIPGGNEYQFAEARIMGQVGVNSRHFHVETVVDLHQLTNRIYFAEIGFGSRLRQHDRVQVFQARAGAPPHRQREQLWCLSFHVGTNLRELFISRRQNMPIGPGRHHDIPEIAAVSGPQFRPQRKRDRTLRTNVTIEGLVLHHLRNAVVVRVDFIERQFIPNPKADEHRHGHAHRQPTDVDGRVYLVVN